jgi:hypothetical protein
MRGNPFQEQSVIYLTKTWSAPSLDTGGSPTEFENLLFNQNHMVDLGKFYFLTAAFFGYTSSNLW